MKIRPIKEKDNLQLCQLIKSILEHENLALPGTAYYDEALTNLSAYYEQYKNAEYFVLIDENDKIYGGVGIAPFSDSVCELQKLYLSPEVRAQGWSNQLMDMALDFAKKHYQHTYLESHTNLATALVLYKKYGFQQLAQPIEGSEHSLMNVWLIKSL